MLIHIYYLLGGGSGMSFGTGGGSIQGSGVGVGNVGKGNDNQVGAQVSVGNPQAGMITGGPRGNSGNSGNTGGGGGANRGGLFGRR